MAKRILADKAPIASLQASFHEWVRSYTNWQSAQQMLTKKREALVKLELASKNEKLPQAQEEGKEVRTMCSVLSTCMYYS